MSVQPIPVPAVGRDPREFRRIPTFQLMISASQRNIDEGRVKTMAEKWDWWACEALTVAARSDGNFDVIEGQHRAMAAKMIGDDSMVLPCLVLPAMSEAEQAGEALAIDRGRKPIDAVQRWSMLKTQGQPHVVAAADVLADHGVAVSKEPQARNTAAAALLLRIAGASGGAVTPEQGARWVDELLTVMFRAWPEDPTSGRDDRLNRDLLLGVSNALRVENLTVKQCVRALTKQRRSPSFWLQRASGQPTHQLITARLVKEAQ